MEAKRKVTRLSREDRTRAILTTARHVFESKGYEKATVAEIAKQVGVVEGTVLHYFPSKRALVIAVTEAFYAGLIEGLQKGVEGIEGFRNRLHYIIHSHLSALDSNSALCAVILSESRGLDRELAQQVHDFNRRYAGILMKVIAAGQDGGDIAASVSPTLIRNVVFGAIEHYLWDIVAGNKLGSSAEVAGQLTSLIIDGVGVGHAGIDADADVRTLVAKLNRMIN
ncbi:MAG: TetR/AcrR family transcriptional regulator [Spongiibacteraceae bacterium]